jgi:hypothetical protein
MLQLPVEQAMLLICVGQEMIAELRKGGGRLVVAGELGDVGIGCYSELVVAAGYCFGQR